MVYTYAQLNPRILTVGDLPNKKCVALNIGQSVEGYNKSHIAQTGRDAVLTPAHVMAFVQRSWRISESESKDTDLIFATYKIIGKGRLILGAFKFGRIGEKDPKGDCFVKSPYNEPSRCIFLAEPASDEDWAKYVGHFLPDSDKLEQNPVRYYEP